MSVQAPCGCDSVMFHRPDCHLVACKECGASPFPDPQQLLLIGREAAVLRQFMFGFKAAFAAFLRECPRPSPDADYAPRLTPAQTHAIWLKLYGEAPT